jgi:hypothetical protein
VSQTSAHMASGPYAREFFLVAAAWALAAALSFAMATVFAPGNLLFLVPAGLAAFAMFRGAYLSAQVSQAFVLRALHQSAVAFAAWIVVFALVLAAGAFAGLSLPGAGQAMGDMLAIGG